MEGNPTDAKAITPTAVEPVAPDTRMALSSFDALWMFDVRRKE
jgi:hypothetical protein